MSYHRKDWTSVLGLAFVMSGLPIAWVLRSYVGASGSQAVSIAVMLIGTSLIASWREFYFLRIYSSSIAALLPLIYLLPVAALGLLFGPQGDDGPYHLIFCLALLIAILSTPIALFRALPTTVAAISLIAAILTLWHVFFGDFWLTAKDIGEEGNRLYAGDSNNPNFIAFVAGYGLIGLSLSMPLRRTAAYFMGAVICWSILGIVILMSTTRSVLLGLAFVASVGIFVNRKMLIQSLIRFPRRIVKVTAIVVVAFVIVSSFYRPYTEIGEIETFSSLLGQIGDGMFSGFQGIVLGQEVSDQSTLDRLEHRKEAINSLNLFGNGYASMYSDNPLLEAFSDLGIFGGLLFVFVALFAPLGRIRHLFHKNVSDPVLRFAAYVYLFNLPNLFLHGRPYDFTLWIPIVLFYGLCFRKTSTQSMQRPPSVTSATIY